MDNEEIKSECEKAYTQIKSAQERLKELRKICTHNVVFEGNWSYRVGSIIPAIICSDCGTLIKLKYID